MGLNDKFSSEGALKGSAIEANEYQSDILAKRTCEIPNSLQVQYDYTGRSDGQPVYIGYGARGISDSADGEAVKDDECGWIIHKFTYTSNMVTKRQTAFGSWDNRSTLTYA